MVPELTPACELFSSLRQEESLSAFHKTSLCFQGATNKSSNVVIDHKTRRPKSGSALKPLLSAPCFIEPMKCKPVEVIPAGSWLYELKLDGFRILGVKNGKSVRLLSRNNNDLSGHFPQIREALANLGSNKFTVDGEIVAVDEAGRPDFEALQNARGRPSPRLFYYVFDLLNHEGEDLTGIPIEERRKRLTRLIQKAGASVRFSENLEGTPDEIVSSVQALGLEGVVAKRSGSFYEAGRRSGAWIKYKTLLEQEFVIGGYTPPQGARQAFGALIVGYYEGKELRYAGKVGSGFASRQLQSLLLKFKAHTQAQCPFHEIPQSRNARWGQGLTPKELRECVWLLPKFVCQVGFTEWTDGGYLRHPVFKGLREDKAAHDVIRERAGAAQLRPSSEPE